MALSPIAKGESPADGRPRYDMSVPADLLGIDKDRFGWNGGNGRADDVDICTD
jgi:hypothetical protein